MNKNVLIIFGADDFEKFAAVEIAKNLRFQVANATYEGKPVNPANAYKADGFELCTNHEAEIDQIIIFECSKTAAGDLQEKIIMICDYHNEGDAGFQKHPDQFWEGSSIGQFCNFIEFSPDHTLLMVAAADHCLSAAYAGLCPRINPVKFRKFRVKQKCEFYKNDPKSEYKSTPESLNAVIDNAIEILKNAENINGIIDLRNFGYINELPEAACILGVGYMTQIDEIDEKNEKTGNKKILIEGVTTPEQISEFIEWAKKLENKVGEPYGNPNRGFAGVVISPSEVAV